MLIIGDSHLKKTKRNKLHNSFRKAKCIVKSFSRGNIQDLEHYATTHLENDKKEIAVIHIGSNNASYKYLDIDASMLAEKNIYLLIIVYKMW